MAVSDDRHHLDQLVEKTQMIFKPEKCHVTANLPGRHIAKRVRAVPCEPFVSSNALKSCRATAYHTLVNCQTKTWLCQHCMEPTDMGKIRLLESVQNKGVRFVCRDYNRTTSTTCLKSSLKWDSLESSRNTKAGLGLPATIVAIPTLQVFRRLAIPYFRNQSCLAKLPGAVCF